MNAIDFAIILKPFLLVVFLLPGAILAWFLKRKLPDGKLKRFLFISWKV